MTETRLAVLLRPKVEARRGSTQIDSPTGGIDGLNCELSGDPRQVTLSRMTGQCSPDPQPFLSGLDGRPRRGDHRLQRALRQGVGSVGAGLPRGSAHHQFPQWVHHLAVDGPPDGGGGVHGLRCRSHLGARPDRLDRRLGMYSDRFHSARRPCVPRTSAVGDRHTAGTGRCIARPAGATAARRSLRHRQLASAVRPGRAISARALHACAFPPWSRPPGAAWCGPDRACGSSDWQRNWMSAAKHLSRQFRHEIGLRPKTVLADPALSAQSEDGPLGGQNGPTSRISPPQAAMPTRRT